MRPIFLWPSFREVEAFVALLSLSPVQSLKAQSSKLLSFSASQLLSFSASLREILFCKASFYLRVVSMELLPRPSVSARRAILLFLLLLLLPCWQGCRPSLCPAVPAGKTAATAPDLRSPLPQDPAVEKGTLANGLTYYIRANHEPKDRAELRLLVRAGSVLEDEDQRGLAHFVEHMAFNGTTHFPGTGVVDTLEMFGMDLGADVNASTGFDATMYQVRIPTKNPKMLDQAFLILEDWAHGVTFLKKDIDEERGVVLEEWRLGRGASTRMRDKILPVLLKRSRYAQRLPIGTRKCSNILPRLRCAGFIINGTGPI